ncbi:hypothetical protein [Winogradskyella tangerina]|uniref:hypothetical protein n=1 Tax=Winogradskyella tangerina TaxID=2023240 RepID=UPI000DBE3975|nr:hypothetical protein [Winogradskyella tangerina]
MNKYTYPFRKGENGILRPKIPIRIINYNTNKAIHTLAMIDTGADCCTFPSMITMNVGHKLDNESKKEKGTRGISGTEIDTYVHPFKIEILDSTRKKVLRTLEVVGNTIMSNSLPPILGTNMFLEKFKITLDYVKKEITLEW